MSDSTALAGDLTEAVERGEAPKVAALLARLRATGWTPAVTAGAPTLLHRALLGPMPGALAVAELLARNGVGLDVRGPGGATPLHHAILEGRDDAAAWLVDRGARIDQRDDAGRTPLELAAAERGRQPAARAAVVQRLLAMGADLGARDARGGTLLHVAVRQQPPAVVEALLQRGLDVAATDGDDREHEPGDDPSQTR
jgi:ankyrin repeat protein